MRLRLALAIVPLSGVLYIGPSPSLCQDSGDQGTMVRGDRAELSITVRDPTGALVTAPATVMLYKDGMPSDQTSTSHGRAFFIPRRFGDFTVVVEASGYRSAQKDVSLMLAGKFEVDIVLQRELGPNEVVGVPGKPILAPEAQKALNKGAQALRDGKLEEAEKELSKAVKLAPANPDVLYIQGMLYMMKRDWVKAEPVLRKSNQIEPDQPRVLSALGMTLCNENKYEQAIPLLEKSSQLEPKTSWETDVALAKSYYFQEQYDQALETAQRAHAKAQGANPQTDLVLARCLTAVGRYEDSAQILRELLKSDASGPDAVTAQRWLDKLSTDGKIHP